MLIEQAILTRLLAASGITSLVGTRIYYVKAPQDVTNPYIVISKVSAVPRNAHDGPLGLVESRFQFSCFGITYKSVKDIKTAIQTALNGFVGTMGGAGGVYVGRCLYENEIDYYLDDVKLYHVAIDYMLMHNE